jgi:hypothetical protein
MPTRLVIEGLVATTGASATAEAADFASLSGIDLDFDLTEATIGDARLIGNSPALQLLFSDTSVGAIEGWRLLGADNIRVTQGSSRFRTQVTTAESTPNGGIAQYVALQSPDGHPLERDAGVSLSGSSLAFRMGEPAVAD